MPAGNKPARKHHYVPQHSLRRFQGEDGILWTYDFQEGKIYPADTKSAGFERDLYSVVSPGGETNHTFFEQILADQVDGPGNAAIERLLKREELEGDIFDFFRYVSVQLVRTPSKLARMSTLAEVGLNETFKRLAVNDGTFRKRIVDRIVSKGGTPEIAESFIRAIMNGDMPLKMTNNFLVPQAFALIDKFEEIITEMRWRFMKMDDSDCDLIVGDHPVLMICPDGDPVGLRHPEIDLILPLSKRVAAIGTWDGDIGYGLLAAGQSALINQNTIRHAGRFAFGSSESKPLLGEGMRLIGTGPKHEVQRISDGSRTGIISVFRSNGIPQTDHEESIVFVRRQGSLNSILPLRQLHSEQR